MSFSERSVCGGSEAEVSSLLWENGVPFRVLVGVICILSMCGATLIVVSYVFFKSLRNRARLILVHISIMDFGTALSKFVGSSINFDQYYVTYNSSCTIYHTSRHQYIQEVCEGQAFFMHFFTMGSVLWTISLAVYLYFLLMHYQASYARTSLYVSYFLCYGVSLLVSVWLLLTGKLGYDGNGYCGIVAVNLLTGSPNQYAAVFGYDLWVYFTMTFVPVLYLAVHLYLRDMLKQSKRYLRDGEEKFKEALTILDYKFFLIPLMFALLRMWTCMRFLFEIYVQLSGVPPAVKLLVFYLSGIGDSAQGMVNGFLYVLLTKSVRRIVLTSCSRVTNGEEHTPILSRPVAGGCVNGQPALAPSRQWRQDRFPTDEIETSEVITPVPFTQSYQSLY